MESINGTDIFAPRPINRLLRSPSMGFSAIDGLPMATRCGELDPHILLFLLNSRKCGAAELETILNQKSGLLGISGISGDMRVLKISKAPAAAAAIDYLVYQI